MEYLRISDYTKGWQTGPPLPKGITKAQIVEDPSTDSMYLIGGHGAKHDIYRLFNVIAGWVPLQLKLAYPRSGHVALFLPDELADLVVCSNQRK